MLEAKVEKTDDKYVVDLKMRSTGIDAIQETVVLVRAVATAFPERYLRRAIIRGISAGLEAMLQEFDELEVKQ